MEPCIPIETAALEPPAEGRLHGPFPVAPAPCLSAPASSPFSVPFHSCSVAPTLVAIPFLHGRLESASIERLVLGENRALPLVGLLLRLPQTDPPHVPRRVEALRACILERLARAERLDVVLGQNDDHRPA